MMDELFRIGIAVIKNLQLTLWDYGSTLIFLSYFGDPKNVYLIFFPAIFSVDRRCGIKTLYAACISEYANMNLKWLLQEDRPYWWVLENTSKSGNTTLHQFPITCETGPGSPSGHVMVSAAVWYVIINDAVKRQGLVVKVLAWILYATVLLSVAVSRMFIAAHFPHQCILGFIIGIALGEVISKLGESALTTRFFSVASLFTFSSSFIVYNLLLTYDLNPDRSVALAMRWCAKREYIHLDTTPLYCTMRYSGSLLGCGLALFLRHGTYFVDHYRLLGRVLLTLLGIGFSRFMTSLPLSDDPHTLYFSSFVIYCVMFVVIVGTLPRILDNKRVNAVKKKA